MNLNPRWFFVPFAEHIPKEEFTFSERKANGIVIIYVQFITVFFNKSSTLRYPNFPLPFRFSNWKFVRIFNFSSEFLFFFHCFSVQHPPPFTAQYKSCSSSLCSFVHLPFNPSPFKTNTSLSPCSSKTFPCLIVGTHTHTPSNTIVCTRNHFFQKYDLLLSIRVICLNSCIRYAGNKKQTCNVCT